MKIRPATIDDVPAVARLVLAALSDESPWKAFFPSKCQNGSEYVGYGEAMLRSYLEPGGCDSWLFLVLELSEAESGTHSGPLIVSAAVFDTSAADSRASTPRNSTDRLHDNSKSSRASRPHSASAQYGRGDLSCLLAGYAAVAATGNASYSRDDEVAAKIPGKLAALSEASLEGRRRRFASHTPCVYLHVLATRPDYQRRGYGKALTAWGIDVARKMQMPVCVQAASRGYILFSGLGFSDLGPVLLPADKGGDELVLKALVLDSSRADRRGSLVGSLLRYISH